MPETFAILPGSPVSMAMQDDDLLVTTSGEIASTGRLYRISKTGGTTDLLHGELGRASLVAADGERVVVGDSTMSSSCEVSVVSGGLLAFGPRAETSVVSRGRRCPRSLTAAADGLFWVEQNAVAHLAPGDSAPTSLFAGTFITGLEPLDADTLLLVERIASTFHLETVPRRGGPATRLLGLDGSAIAVRDGQVAFEQGSDIVVQTLATGTQARIPMRGAPGTVIVTAIALDASFAYWLSDGALFVGDPVARTQRELARVHGVSLLQDETFLYVLSSERGAAQISRIRKPANARPSDGSATCSSPLRRCDFDDCTDLETDRSNCGECGRGCAAGEVCEAGVCECDPTFVCGSSCVDPMVDPQHCGACDHACPGACVGGACAPVALTTNGPNPIDVFAQDETAIYFARGGLRRLDKQTHAISPLNTMEFLGSIAVDTSTIYLTEYGTSSKIHALAKTGASSSVVYPNRPDARQIGLMGNTLVWTEDEAFGDDTRKLVRAAKNGGAILGSLTPVGLFPNADIAFSVGYAIDGETVYWLFDTRDFGGAVARADFSTSPPTISLVTLLDLQPTSIALRGDDLFVSMEHNGDTDDAVIVSIPKQGGSPTFVANAATPSALTVSSDGRLSWIERGNFVRELDPILALPRMVASSTQHASVVLSDDRGFYVATGVGILFVQR